MPNDESKESWKFSGFAFPTYTQIPDQLFDELLPILSGAELKVLLYICRRTFGFKRESDNISLNQMLAGIVKKDGTHLDHGTGLSKSTLLKAIKSLVDMNLIMSEQRSSESNGNEPTNYRLNIRDSFVRVDEGGVSEKETPLGIKIDLGVDRFLYQGLGIKIDPTTNSSTTNSETRNSNNNRVDSTMQETDIVVVALHSRRIAKRVAEQLAQQHTPAYIEEKIAFHDFLVAERPSDIKKPAAWLRSAIENDYSAPDGFISAQDREVLANAEKRRNEALVAAQEERQRVDAETDRQQRAKQEWRLLWLHEKYNTPEDAIPFWKAVQRGVEQEAGVATYALIADAYILTLNGSTAQVGTPSTFKLSQLAHPGTQAQLNRVASRIAKHEIKFAFVLIEGLPE